MPVLWQCLHCRYIALEVLKMMELIEAFERNPHNPKNVQISFAVFMAATKFIEEIDTSTFTESKKAAYKYVLNGLLGKKCRVISRQAYAEIGLAKTAKEKQEAYAAYQETKEFTSAMLKATNNG